MCLVGPEEATELLKLNTHNRPISKVVVDKYVIEMQMGEWFPTASGIGIDSNGVLVDGQTRLTAVVIYGKPVFMLIVTNLPPRSQEKVDRQRRRSLPDALYLSEECKSRKVVQTATFLARYDKNSEHIYTARFPADAEVKAAIAVHQIALDAVCNVVAANKKGLTQVGVRAALTLAYEIYGEGAIEFYKRMRSGIADSAGDPSFRCRRVLLHDGYSVPTFHGGLTIQVWVFRTVLYFFNAFIQGKKTHIAGEADSVIPKGGKK
jgi:hypothetical protein